MRGMQKVCKVSKISEISKMCNMSSVSFALIVMLISTQALQAAPNSEAKTTRYPKLIKDEKATKSKNTRPTRKNLKSTQKNTQDSKESQKESKQEAQKDALAQDSIDRIQYYSQDYEESGEKMPIEQKPPRLIGDLLRLYISNGVVSSSSTATQNTNSMSKEVATCPAQLCRGDTTSASYQGTLGKGYALEIGVEHFFDRFDIFGIRLFGEVSAKNGGLGELISSSPPDKSTNNLQDIRVKDKDDNLTPTGGKIPIVSNEKDDWFTFAPTPQPSKDLQGTLANNGTFMTFGFGGDIIVNAPFDYWLRKAVNAKSSWWKNRLAYLKIGGFFGGGVEFGRFSQGDSSDKSWQNELAAQGKSSNLYDAFFASGSGAFLRYGVSAYITRFFRVNFGYKHNFYNIAAERWYGYNGLNCANDLTAESCIKNNSVRQNDPKSETLLRQKYVISHGDEWFLNLALSF